MDATGENQNEVVKDGKVIRARQIKNRYEDITTVIWDADIQGYHCQGLVNYDGKGQVRPNMHSHFPVFLWPGRAFFDCSTEEVKNKIPIYVKLADSVAYVVCKIYTAGERFEAFPGDFDANGDPRPSRGRWGAGPRVVYGGVEYYPCFGRNYVFCGDDYVAVNAIPKSGNSKVIKKLSGQDLSTLSIGAFQVPRGNRHIIPDLRFERKSLGESDNKEATPEPNEQEATCWEIAEFRNATVHEIWLARDAVTDQVKPSAGTGLSANQPDQRLPRTRSEKLKQSTLGRGPGLPIELQSSPGPVSTTQTSPTSTPEPVKVSRSTEPTTTRQVQEPAKDQDGKSSQVPVLTMPGGDYARNQQEIAVRAFHVLAGTIETTEQHLVNLKTLAEQLIRSQPIVTLAGNSLNLADNLIKHGNYQQVMNIIDALHHDMAAVRWLPGSDTTRDTLGQKIMAMESTVEEEMAKLAEDRKASRKAHKHTEALVRISKPWRKFVLAPMVDGQVDGAKAKALAATGPFYGEDGAPWNITRILKNPDNPESGPFGQFVFCKRGTDGEYDKEDAKDQQKKGLFWTWDGKPLPADNEQRILVPFDKWSGRYILALDPMQTYKERHFHMTNDFFYTVDGLMYQPPQDKQYVPWDMETHGLSRIRKAPYVYVSLLTTGTGNQNRGDPDLAQVDAEVKTGRLWNADGKPWVDDDEDEEPAAKKLKVFNLEDIEDVNIDE
ncbi:hypothetical protein G647_06430 [Cladophialophora carrionii CBS 160.54]|uniref:Uncharacterized protein n=1 Tax=Cladophialophora carrionii CBS 160.54 TaxID=1279043 RepID=V9D6V2_9EURO|nr:uncharacterized protein G647_06430 [Cladophialophora carrionii CBS 160.54]ETI22356.1 hypothetical protein G647_06430 [Cladophialophora carrionii CBS 160.54]